VIELPKHLQRCALEVDGWLDLGCPERALQSIDRLLEDPVARPVAWMLRVRALVPLGRHADALQDLTELRRLPKTDVDQPWLELTEAWCRKRLDDLPGAIECMRRLLEAKPRSAIGHFNLACYLALHGDSDRAVEELAIACGLDEEFRALARTETDLVSLRRDPRYRALLPKEE
jgi:tetratricopeptide (TPR) repeat protein